MHEHDASLPAPSISHSHFLLIRDGIALATLLLEATFPGLVETAYLLVPAGEAGKESLFFMRAEAAFSGVPLLCSPTNALLTLDDDDFAFVATFVDGDELELLSSSLT